ncbi:MAG TPA: tRNA (N6-isopentenyl adenosine(37)-C2)-methylthiotransferase MiaB [Flavobacteriales bacterium]|jgi:tRNA-2-methylthio-N6-dimethylallyladenosine synthase|nr:tRNA (N6-isopentenyl adenosine(37)-C2)-methylthiotransferase MiaB [Flavobacteriales bacterium]
MKPKEETLVQTASNLSKKVYIETYGCQMNFSDSEIVASVLTTNGYQLTNQSDDADLVLINTCSIRDNAERKVLNRLNDFKRRKKKEPSFKVGVLGCMAERMKADLLDEKKMVDIVVGPDAYRDLPDLLEEIDRGRKAVNVLLSREETYDDIEPVRLDQSGVTAFISIMRGCDNMCAFCVVPFTRGRERSRDPQTIVSEASELVTKGYREVTLLGQNVDSYHWSEGGLDVNFAQLLELVAQVSPLLRIRFSTSHPKDMTDDVLVVMSKYQNICEYIHLPVQSGNSAVLERMNRGYSREWYLERIASIKSIMPNCAISTDIITGFCGETQKEHQDTIELMDLIEYDFAYMFKYSERPRTLAERRMEDDVPDEEKNRRLQEIIRLQNHHSQKKHSKYLGRTLEVLVEGTSKRSEEENFGRTTYNTVVVFPKGESRPGDYVQVMITDFTSATLKGKIV